MLKKIFIGLVILLLLLLVIGGVYIWNVFNSFERGVSSSYEDTVRERSELRVEDIDEDLETFTVLFMGIDERRDQEKPEEGYRTDSLILSTFNLEEDEIKLVSIPRDTLTYLPGVGYYDKITHAHRNGGPEASILAVESLLNVPVDYYVRVNMQALVDVVDALNGVEFDVPFDMNEPNAEDHGRIILKEGRQLLNGEEALAVVRSRRVDTDLGRGNRQLEMVQAIMQKAKSTGALRHLNTLIEVSAKNSRHNLPTDKVRSIAAYYMFNDLEFTTTQLRGEDYWFQGNNGYFYDPNLEHLYLISKTLREDLNLPRPRPNDITNIRLRDIYDVYQEYDKSDILKYRSEGIPYFMEVDWNSTLGDGFNIKEPDLMNDERNNLDSSLKDNHDFLNEDIPMDFNENNFNSDIEEPAYNGG